MNRAALALWFGVFGAPLAWSIQHVTGYALTEATCKQAGRMWDVNLDAWTIAVSAVALGTACAAGAAAVFTYRTHRGTDAHGDPPGARYYFLSLIGMAITPLFVAMILMSGLGSVLLAGCRQS